MTDYTRTIAEHLANTTYEDLTPEAIEFAKKSIMDTLGIMFPATTLAPTSDVVHDLVLSIDEGGKCLMIGYGERASLLEAAFMNGSLTHAVDFDDSAGIERPLVHPTGSCLPAALTLADFLGTVSGKDLILAIALADDLGIRLADCVKGNILWDYDFFPITTIGVFQATAAAAVLLHLSADQMVDALGLAVNRVSGIRDTLFNCEFRSIRDAFGNQEGIRCALLASRGFEGCKTALEDLMRIIYKGNVDMEPLVRDLGVTYTNATLITYKMWPSCQGTQAYAEAILQILEAHPHLDLAEIGSIQLKGPKESQDLFYPKEEKARPKTSITSKVSIPFVVATMLKKRNLVLADFEVQNLSDPDVIALTDLLELEVDDSHGANAATAIVTLKDGTVIENRADSVRGSVFRPLTLEQLVTKFKGNAQLARYPIGDIDGLADALLHLEDATSVKDVLSYLC
ncbi:MAG: MmgE/PrpD family protein [Eggerthellaceae bacterium]|nr:MmgE/PrpD family protein [Eggerthellaceae bacterium]